MGCGLTSNASLNVMCLELLGPLLATELPSYIGSNFDFCSSAYARCAVTSSSYTGLCLRGFSLRNEYLPISGFLLYVLLH